MGASKKEQIQNSLAARLLTITTANGYDTNISKVFNNEIPMGMDLEQSEVPAILVIAGRDIPKHEHQWLKGNWEIELQLVHNAEETDATMHRFVRDVNRAIYANSPTAIRRDAWREFDGKPSGWWIDDIVPDLFMIDANRCSVLNYIVSYHTDVLDL